MIVSRWLGRFIDGWLDEYMGNGIAAEYVIDERRRTTYLI